MSRTSSKARGASEASGATLAVPSSMHRSRSSSFGSGEAVSDDEPLPSPIWTALCCNSGRGALSWNGLGVVFSALTLGSLGIHLLLEYIGDDLDVGRYTVLATLAVVIIMVAVPLTHGIVGTRKNGSLYTFFQPFIGGLRFVLLQVIAWSLWTATILAGIYGVWVGGSKLTSGWLSAVGLGGVVSQLLVLVSLHFFVSNASTKQNESVAAMKLERAKAHRVKLREKRRKNDALRSKDLSRKSSSEEDHVDQAPEQLPASSPSTHLSAAASTSFWPWGSVAMKATFIVIATLSLLLALFIESKEVVPQLTSVRLQSLLTSAILIAVPVTHILARRSMTHAGYLLFQPFKGGSKFVLLQAIAWTLWTLAFVSAGGSFIIFAMNRKSDLTDLDADLPSGWSWLSSLITSAGVAAILSQALVLLSLQYFDSKITEKIGTTARVLAMVRRNEQSALSPHDRPAASVSPIAKAKHEKDLLDRAVMVLSSPKAVQRRMLHKLSPRNNTAESGTLLSTPIPAPSTPAKFRATESVDEDVNDVPTLFLPTAIQAQLEHSDDTDSPESPHSPEPSTLSHLSLRDFTQSLFLALHYARSRQWVELGHELALDMRSFIVISMLYMVVPIVGAVGTFVPIVLMYSLHPLPWYCYTFYLSIVLMYLSTYRNRPSHTGARSWPAVRNSDMLWSSMQRYFNGVVVPLGSLSEAQGPYIFGFHPHGVYPMTCFWATRGAHFRQSYPGLQIDVCAASIMFFAPLLREVVMWTGGREVSGSSIRTALKHKRSIMLVPGGQREMRHSAADRNVLTLVTRHRGFIRMALEHGTPLVPVLSIGETMLLENVHAPRMQAYTLRMVGVGFPIWPYGRWYSPLPNAHPVVVIFGQAIPVPLNKDPSLELIDTIHRVYYEQLQDIFAKHRHMIPGFENCKLVFTED